MISLHKNQSPKFSTSRRFYFSLKSLKSNMFKHPLFHALVLLCHDEPSFNFWIIVKVVKIGEEVKWVSKITNYQGPVVRRPSSANPG